MLIGLYYIDPNEGSKNDAVLVYCQMKQQWTCVNTTNGLIQTNLFLDNQHLTYRRQIRLIYDLLKQNEVKKERKK
jgi:hypothetical protein